MGLLVCREQPRGATAPGACRGSRLSRGSHGDAGDGGLRVPRNCLCAPDGVQLGDAAVHLPRPGQGAVTPLSMASGCSSEPVPRAVP